MSNTTKHCPKCKEEININASKCPKCHADLRNWFVRHKIITAVLILLVIGMVGSAMRGTEDKDKDEKVEITVVDENGETTTKEVSAIPVTANQLCDAYKANEVKANDNYKGNKLEITGVVDDIETALFTDSPVVKLKCGGEYSFADVRCTFKSETEASELNIGDQITVTGEGSGVIMESPTVDSCKVK